MPSDKPLELGLGLDLSLKDGVQPNPISFEEVKNRLEGIRGVIGEALMTAAENKGELSPENQEILLTILKSRFEKNCRLHKDIQWQEVEKSLKSAPGKLRSLLQLEVTGGEPDVITENEGEFVFGDCSAESPIGRRNFAFDKESQEYLEKRYNRKFDGNAIDKAEEDGVDLMDKKQYGALQKKMKLDQESFSLLKTPDDIRNGNNAVGCYRNGKYVIVDTVSLMSHNADGAFRAVVKVKKV